MPQVIFKGVHEQSVATISTALTKELSRVMQTPEDWFSVEYQPNVFYFQGQKIPQNPLVQVWWFDRGQQVQDETAAAIDRLLRAQGYEQIEISFHPLEKSRYYENAQHH